MWLLAQIRLGKGSGKLNWKGAVLLVSLRPQSTPYIYIGQRQKFKNIYHYICGSNLINLCIFFRKSLGSLRQLPQECLILYRNYKTNEVAKQLQTGTVCLHIRQSWDRGWLKMFIIYGTEAFLKSCFYGSHKLLSKQLQEPLDAVSIFVAKMLEYFLQLLGKRLIRLNHIQIFKTVQKSNGKIGSREAAE